MKFERIMLDDTASNVETTLTGSLHDWKVSILDRDYTLSYDEAKNIAQQIQRMLYYAFPPICGAGLEVVKPELYRCYDSKFEYIFHFTAKIVEIRAHLG